MNDVADLLDRLDRARITLVHGKKDLIAPIQYVRTLVDCFPDLALRELNGGHHLYLAYPTLVNQLLLSERRGSQPWRHTHDAWDDDSRA